MLVESIAAKAIAEAPDASSVGIVPAGTPVRGALCAVPS
jgi:hypothetical protein